MTTVIVLLISALCVAYYFLRSHYKYWEKRGVPGPKPLLLFGNMKDNFLMKKSQFEIFANIYNQYNRFPFAGIFKGTTPSLLICDPELIKDITLKSFQYFHNNDFEVDKERDPILGRNPFVLKGEEWKIVRSQLTPGFTSGKVTTYIQKFFTARRFTKFQMKFVYPLLEATSKTMVEYVKTTSKKKGNQVPFETKELCSKLTLNNVASCAFGLDSKAFSDDSSEFKEIAKNFFQSSFIQNVLFIFLSFIPSLAKIIKLKFVSKETEERLENLVRQTLKYRQDNNIVRNDFLHILSKLKETCKEYNFTDVDVTAHASGFFLDGYETSASVMSFILYELAANPETQTTLREEIVAAFDENSDLSYEVVQRLPYLEAVILETLRLHPPLFSLGKICTKNYTYIPRKGDGIGNPVLIEKGTPIVIPLSGLHTDPRYFHDPEKFSPDRFMGTNKDDIVKYAYLPFGEGPRACLGQRFGLLQIKVGLIHLIRNFKIHLNEKTKLPLQYDPSAFILAPVGGLWVNFESVSE